MRYILGVIAAIVVAVFAIILIVNRNPGTPDPSKQGERALVLTEDAQDGAVSHVTQGRLVGEDQRRSIRITVDRNSRTIEILRGYDQAVEKSQTFPNTTAAYEAFLQGLENAGFAREREYRTKDERGICALGYRYIYEVEERGNEELRLWSTSCSERQGTFAGSASLVRQLFQNQIPEYGRFISGVQL